MKEKLKLSDVWIVVPGYNESKYLESVLQKLTAVTPRFIFVDDGSTDNSVYIAQKYTKHVLIHQLNLGKGAALKTGCEYAFNHLQAQAVIFMDSDDQHDPNEISLFISALQAGHQVVFGVRQLNHHMPILRKIGNKFTTFLIMMMFGQAIPDIPSGYKALTKKAYNQVKWNSTDYGVEMEIAARVAKTKLKFIPVTIKTIYHDLDRGMTFLDILKMINQIITLKFTL